MTNRRTVLLSATALPLLAILPSSAIAQTLCEVWSKTALWDFRHALWGSTGTNPGDRVIHVMGAPWCPYTRRIVTEFFDGGIDCELRLSPIDVIQHDHRLMQADIVLNNADGMKRTFLDGTPPPAVAPELAKLIFDANFIAQEGLKLRLSPALTTPTLVYQESDGASSFAGYKALADIAANVTPIGYPIADLALDLESILASLRRLPGRPVATILRPTAIHALPDTVSASVGCLSKTKTVQVVAETEWKQTDWLQILAFQSTDHEPIHGFVSRNDARLG